MEYVGQSSVIFWGDRSKIPMREFWPLVWKFVLFWLPQLRDQLAPLFIFLVDSKTFLNTLSSTLYKLEVIQSSLQEMVWSLNIAIYDLIIEEVSPDILSSFHDYVKDLLERRSPDIDSILEVCVNIYGTDFLGSVDVKLPYHGNGAANPSTITALLRYQSFKLEKLIEKY